MAERINLFERLRRTTGDNIKKGFIDIGCKTVLYMYLDHGKEQHRTLLEIPYPITQRGENFLNN
jgi:hypothetical protein